MNLFVCDESGEVPACEGGASMEATLRKPKELAPFLDEVLAVLAGLGYSPRDRLAVWLAIEEAAVNGLRHGNRGDPTKSLRVRCRVTPNVVLAEVEDEGQGFALDRVNDPTRPENLDRPGGRGLLLMRHFMTWVRFSDPGNRVLLCKRRSA